MSLCLQGGTASSGFGLHSEGTALPDSTSVLWVASKGSAAAASQQHLVAYLI